MPELLVETVGLNERRDDLYAIRFDVFCDEQGFARDVEIDDKDADSLHVLASLDGVPVGTGRLVPASGKVTRMAVVAAARHRKVGSAIMEHLVKLAKELGLDRLRAHSQVQAIPFYEANGFRVVGPEFMEEGVPHRLMERYLT